MKSLVDDIAALERKIGETLAESEAKIVSGYLFGSHAEGRAHRESDVDVAVLFDRAAHPDAADRFDNRLRISTSLQSALRTDHLDLVVLNDVPPGFGRAIVTRGRRCFLTDPEQDHQFVRDVQIRAADLDPFLKRMSRIKLEALRRDAPGRAAR